MEIPAWLFFSFWAVISITFLHLGFYALDKTELSSSVSPVVMSVFKHSLAISSCCSSTSALILGPRSIDHIVVILFPLVFLEILFLWHRVFSPKWKVFYSDFFDWLDDFLSSRILWGVLLCILITIVMFIPTDSILPLIPIMALINFIGIMCVDDLTPQQRTSIGIHMASETSLFFINNETTKFFAILVLFLSISNSMIWTALSPLAPYTRVPRDETHESSTKLMSLAMKLKDILLTLKEKKMLLKLIAFGVGTLGSLLFQHFFKLTSFNHVIAFLSLAVTWLANLALLGVFNFLLGNVVVGCTVNQFGLQSTTWIAYGASLLLFGLRLKLESLQHIQVMLWSESS